MRALGHVSDGRYIEVGANDPVIDSVTHAFYDAGGAASPSSRCTRFAERHREQRPRDILVEAAISERPDRHRRAAPDRRHRAVHRCSTRSATVHRDVRLDRGRHRGAGAAAGRRPRSTRAGTTCRHPFHDDRRRGCRTDRAGHHRSAPLAAVGAGHRGDRAAVDHAVPRAVGADRSLDAGYRFCLFDGLSRVLCRQRTVRRAARGAELSGLRPRQLRAPRPRTASLRTRRRPAERSQAGPAAAAATRSAAAASDSAVRPGADWRASSAQTRARAAWQPLSGALATRRSRPGRRPVSDPAPSGGAGRPAGARALPVHRAERHAADPVLAGHRAAARVRRLIARRERAPR